MKVINILEVVTPWYRYHRHFINLGRQMSPKPLVSIFEAKDTFTAIEKAKTEDKAWERFMNAKVEEGSESLEIGSMVRRSKKVFLRQEYVDIEVFVRAEPAKFVSTAKSK